MTIAQQVNLAMSQASVCLGQLSPGDQVLIAAQMQAVVDALNDSSAVHWPVAPAFGLPTWRNPAADCIDLADSGVLGQQSYQAGCQNWEDVIVFQLRNLGVMLGSVGCSGAAEVALSASESVAGESEQAGVVTEIEIPGAIKWGAGASLLAGAAFLVLWMRK